MPADMRRSTSSRSSSSFDHLWQPRSVRMEFGVRSHSISSNKSPVKFQIQTKRNPIVQYSRSDRTEGSLHSGTADASKSVMPKAAAVNPTDTADGVSASKTEALKNLSLYESDDSDIEQTNEIVTSDRPRIGAKSSSDDINVASAEKVGKPKVEDNSRSGHHHKKEHSDARDTEQQSGHKGRDDFERKRSSLSKGRHSSKERKTSRSKDTPGDKKSREYRKSGSDRRHDRKSQEDEMTGAERSYKLHSDCDSKKSHESASRSAEKMAQTQLNSTSSHTSSSDRHRESSRSFKEPRKPESYLLPVGNKPMESSLMKEDTTVLHKSTDKDRLLKMGKADKMLNYKVPSDIARKSPSRANSHSSSRKSSDKVSRSSNKVTVDKEDITDKAKLNEAEPHSKVDTSRKPVKSCLLYTSPSPRD